jgi:hypothetical protein
MTCRRLHFEPLVLLQAVAASPRDPDGLLAVEPTCRCGCCAGDADTVAGVLEVVDAKRQVASVDRAALKDRLDPHLLGRDELGRAYEGSSSATEDDPRATEGACAE